MGKQCYILFMVAVLIHGVLPSNSIAKTGNYSHYFFLLDMSGSMDETRKNPSLPYEKTTVYRMKKAMKDYIRLLSDGAHVTIFLFHKGIQDKQDFVLPDDEEKFRIYIDSLIADGDVTYAWSSLDHVLQVATNTLKVTVKTIPNIIVITDGDDNEQNGPELLDVLANYDILYKLSKNSRLKVITLGFQLNKVEKEAIDKYSQRGVSTSFQAKSEDIMIPIVAQFEWWRLNPLIKEEVKFFNRSNPERAIDTYKWIFSDGFTFTTKDVVRTFPNIGEYKATLNISGNGMTDSVSQTITIISNEPVANFSVVPIRGRVPHTVKIENLSKGENNEYIWDFGDGQTSNDIVPQPHVYQEKGDYLLTLRVRGPGGESKPMQQTIHVEPPLPVGMILLAIVGFVIVSIIFIVVWRAFHRPITLEPVYDLEEIYQENHLNSHQLKIGFGKKCSTGTRNHIAFPENLDSSATSDLGILIKTNLNVSESAKFQGMSTGICQVIPINDYSLTHFDKQSGEETTIGEEKSVSCRNHEILTINEQPFVLHENSDGNWQLVPGWKLKIVQGVRINYKRNGQKVDVLYPKAICVLEGDEIHFEQFEIKFSINLESGYFLMETTINKEEDEQG